MLCISACYFFLNISVCLFAAEFLYIYEHKVCASVQEYQRANSLHRVLQNKTLKILFYHHK